MSSKPGKGGNTPSLERSLRLPAVARMDALERSQVILSERKESVREGKLLTDRFRKAANLAIFTHRFEQATHGDDTPHAKLKQRQAAPFSSVTRYQTVRRMLDPVRHQHLLGDDDGLTRGGGGGGGNGRRGTVPGGATTPSHTSLSSSSRIEPGSGASGGRNSRQAQQEQQQKRSMKPRRGQDGDTTITLAEDGEEEESILSDDDDDDDGSNSAAGGRAHPREKVHLPTGCEVKMLPKELALTFQNVAMQRLRDLLYPRVLLARLRRVRQINRVAAQQNAMQLSTDFFKKVKFFAEWPADAITAVYNALEYDCCNAGSFVRFAEEKAAHQGILIVAHGSIEALKRTNQLEKRLSRSNTTVVQTYNVAPNIFNEHCFITDEPVSRTLRAVTKCDLYFLRRKAFDECFAMLPPAVRASVLAQGTAKRQRSLMEFYPLYPHTLQQQCKSFKHCSPALLDQVLAVLKSLAVSANQTIVRSREVPSSVLFLRRGKVSQHRLIRGEPTNIRTFVAPATLFENCIAERSEYPDMLRAATECDFLLLSLDDLTHLMTQNPHEAAALLEACHGERMQSLSMQQVAFRPLVYRVPLVRTVCTSEELAVLTFLFESKVYPAMSIIASKSDCCDRIVVLMKGAVSFGVKGKWAIGEAVGYTALVSHRWACSAVAINTCETLELRVDLLRAFLTDSGKLDLATRITEAMLFPIKFEIDAREQYLAEQGVALVPKVRELHRTGRLPVPHRNANGGFGSEGTEGGSGSGSGGGAITVHGGNPHLHSNRNSIGRTSGGDAPSARDLGYLVDKVRDDVASLFTPLMHPISPATTRSQSELGFASISKPEMFGVDYFVPNGLFVPHLSTEDRETMVIKAVAAQKRTPFRKMVHITPFLLVKQK